MKIYFLLVFVLVSFFNIPTSAQESSEQKPTCEQPFSSKFDEFEFTNLENARERLDLFGSQIKNLNAYGIIIAYGGKTTESSQARSIGYQVEEYLTEKFTFYKYVTISARDGGHRENPMVELFIRPERCSQSPETSPTLSPDEVTYKEEVSFFPKDVRRKNSNDLEDLSLNKITPLYPAAAKAIRARGKVLVLIVVDEKGNVIKAAAIDGHPLLRAASEIAVRNWKYQTVKEDKKSVKFGGKVVIDWDAIADKWFSEYTLSND